MGSQWRILNKKQLQEDTRDGWWWMLWHAAQYHRERQWLSALSLQALTGLGRGTQTGDVGIKAWPARRKRDLCSAASSHFLTRCVGAACQTTSQLDPSLHPSLLPSLPFHADFHRGVCLLGNPTSNGARKWKNSLGEELRLSGVFREGQNPICVSEDFKHV